MLGADACKATRGTSMALGVMRLGRELCADLLRY